MKTKDSVDKRLILTFGLLSITIHLPLLFLSLAKIVVFTRVKNLIPCLLPFWSASVYFNPYLRFNFYYPFLLTFYKAELLIYKMQINDCSPRVLQSGCMQKQIGDILSLDVRFL